MGNIVANLSSGAVPEVKFDIDAVYGVPAYEGGEELATDKGVQ